MALKKLYVITLMAIIGVTSVGCSNTINRLERNIKSNGIVAGVGSSLFRIVDISDSGYTYKPNSARSINRNSDGSLSGIGMINKSQKELYNKPYMPVLLARSRFCYCVRFFPSCLCKQDFLGIVGCVSLR